MSVVRTAACCWRQAAETEVQATQITDQHLKAVYLRIAHHWSVLARSYEFADSAERFLSDAKRSKDATARAPNAEIIVPPLAAGHINLRDELHRNLTVGNDAAFPMGSLPNVLEAGDAASPMT